MASLQTLRNKGGVIVAVVIGLALLSFILGDMLSSGSTLFGSSNDVGKINGTTITAEQYNQQINTLSEVVKVTTGSETISEEQSEVIQQQAWEQLITQYAVAPELNEIGLSVGVDEMAELITGRYVSPSVQQLFTDPQTGLFEPALVRQFVQNISADPTGRLQLFWDNLQSDIASQTQLMKYKTLIDKGAYVTSQQADFLADMESSSVNISFVAQKMSAVADSTIEVSNSEIKKYYEANKEAFNRNAARSIEYVVFEALPSVEDYKEAEKYISKLKEEFEGATNVEQFVSLNSFSPFDTRYYKEGELEAGLNEFAFSASSNDIYAPEMASDEFVLARISDVKELPDSLNFSHILFAPNQKATADSLLNAIKSGSTTFAAAAAEFSMDSQTASLEGSYGTIDPQMLPAELSKEVLAMNSGELKLIELPNSIHITKVSGIKGIGKKVQLGTIKYKVEPSEATRAIAFNRAANFANGAPKTGFNKLAQDSLLSKRVVTLTANQRELQGYENSREVVRWAFNNEMGASSEVMEFGDSFLVLSLATIQEEGIAPYEAAAAQIKLILMNEKKGEMLAKNMAGKSVDALATELGVTPTVGSDITFTTYIAPEVGFDPAFAGGVVGLAQSTSPKPIVGLAAVYVAKVDDVASNPVSSSMIKERLLAEIEQGAFYGAYQTLIKNSSITDTRYKFF